MGYDRFVGIPYEQLNCYQLVRRFYLEDLETELPEEPSFDGWLKVTEPQFGDVAAFASGDAGVGVADGCGVFINSEQLLIARKGYDSVIIRLRNLGGTLLGVYRRDS